jgi:hypothetical protein
VAGATAKPVDVLPLTMQAPVLLVEVVVWKTTLQMDVGLPVPIICATLEALRTLNVKFFVAQPESTPVTVIDSRLNVPEARTVDGTTVMPSLSQEVVAVKPWPNSMLFAVPIVMLPARVDPIVGIKITAARPSAILRLRFLLFFFITGSSSEPRFNVFISYLLFSRFWISFKILELLPFS